ncbi:transcriptional regulator [uncultured Parvimonas sp.]|uniref:transcriptional regulator n=1 Tax=uncultured Parvimonas sp. TaxID=747372 RepID=UPI0037DD8EDF
MSGLTDVAIRNYELRNRSPNKEQLRKIADVLNCDISALIDHESNSIFEIIHIIFDNEKEMKFRPLAGNGEPTALLYHNPHFDDFLVEWDKMSKKHYNGEITDEEFEDWKLSFPKKSRFLK